MFEIIDAPVEHVIEAEPELTPSGRLRRGAAKRLVPTEPLCSYVIWFLNGNINKYDLVAYEL